jgi:mannose-1-phosphate guanylyltransferase
MDCVKPLFPIAGHATIYHHVQALTKVPGLTEILLIGFYEQGVFDRFLLEVQIEFPLISIRYSVLTQLSEGIPEHGNCRWYPSFQR